MSSTDRQAGTIDHHESPALRGVIHEAPVLGSDTGITELRCPYKDCECGHHTHIIDVVWECDPSEGDRRWVRMEVRCEMGRGYFLLIRNHAGHTRLEYKLIDGEVSPLAGEARW